MKRYEKLAPAVGRELKDQRRMAASRNKNNEEPEQEQEIQLPSSFAACADLLYKTREARYLLQKKVKQLAAVESALENHFVESLSKSDTTGVSGKVAHVQLQTKTKPIVEDWDKFYAFVRKTGSFELLQRRLNEGAVVERRDAGQRVPGTGNFHYVDVSCTAVKR